ncbi:MAG: DUF89 family protein [Candidatus Anammoximicrobium sp.]|nr:DUF89 family protein [Candidatus Anammoximicrobium sp.]
MKTYFDCIPCMIRQALDSARLASEDETVHERILREALVAASELDLCQPPPAMAQRVHRRIRQLTGKDDPYREAKDRQNRMAREFYERFSPEVACADNKLEMAVRLAIAGNVIDLGVKSNLDQSQIDKAIETCLTEPLDGDIPQFAAAIAKATRILYLADNAGEIVLDRLLIEQLPREKLTVAVRGAPVINDATRVDAETAGITGLVPVIDNGSDAPGTILEDCSGVFRRHFAEADLIIAKGQGNYETLREAPCPLYFLLRVKCSVLARDLGCPVGRMVLRSASSLPRSEPEVNQVLPSLPLSVHREPTMKIAVTADAPSLEAAVDLRFARCPYLVLVDSGNGTFEALENTAVGAGSGAGIQTAQTLASNGVQVLLTGNCGPHAFQTLSAAGIRVVPGCSGTVREVVERYTAGQLPPADEPDLVPYFGADNAAASTRSAPAQPGLDLPVKGGQDMGRGGGQGKGRAPGPDDGQSPGGGRGLGRGRRGTGRSGGRRGNR